MELFSATACERGADDDDDDDDDDEANDEGDYDHDKYRGRWVLRRATWPVLCQGQPRFDSDNFRNQLWSVPGVGTGGLPRGLTCQALRHDNPCVFWVLTQGAGVARVRQGSVKGRSAKTCSRRRRRCRRGMLSLGYVTGEAFDGLVRGQRHALQRDLSPPLACDERSCQPWD